MKLDPAKLENISFGRWFLRLTPTRKLMPSLATAAPIVLGCISLYLTNKPKPPPNASPSLPPDLDTLLLYSIGLQFFVVLALTFLVPRGYSRAIERAEYEQRIVHRFLRKWRNVWFSWIGLYLVLFGCMLLKMAHVSFPDWLQDLLADTANNAQTFFFIAAYSLLAKVPYRTSNSAPESSEPGTGLEMAVVALGTLTVFELVFGLIFQGAGVEAAVFRITSALGAGMALAMFIGRLESVFLGVPRLIILFLYSYAIVQVGYALLGHDLLLSILVVNLALVLKIVFFLLVTWVVSSGRLLFYVRQMASVRDLGERHWAAFLMECRERIQPLATEAMIEAVIFPQVAASPGIINNQTGIVPNVPAEPEKVDLGEG